MEKIQNDRRKDGRVQELKARIDEWKIEIDMLEKSADETEAVAASEYHKKLDDLRARLKDLENKIAELSYTGEDAWEDFKQGLENSWDILKTGFIKAKSEFERGYKAGRKS